MAVYLLSLQQLVDARARRAEHERRHPVAIPTKHPEPSAPSNAAAIQEDKRASDAPSTRATEPELSTTAEQLLEMSTTQLRALLCQCSEPGNKVMLAMMYRLAVIEQQLAELGRRPTSGVARPAQLMATPEFTGRFHGTSKSELLEQLFRKNLSLRESD